MRRRRGIAMAAVLCVLALAGCRPAPLPILSTLPPFTLQSQEGVPFGSEDLRGEVWIANFVFTRCPTVCPVFTAQMRGIQVKAAGAEGLRFVSFSVDPAYDTPPRLKEYGAAHGADFSSWTFLTGDPEAIKAAVVTGLKVAADPPLPDQDLASVFHGTHFVLVDADLRIRGYYDSSEPERIEALLRDAMRIRAR